MGPRPEKVAVVEEVRQRLTSADAAILTEYRGLSVTVMAELRRILREAGGDYKVYKNTLVRLAVRNAGLSDLEPLLLGPTAIAFVDGDAARVAKALRDFSRTHPALVVKGGLLDKGLLSAAQTTALAELPPREVLLAQVAGALAAPMQRMAALLKALPQNLAYGLRALIDQAPPGQAQTPATEGANPAEDAQSTLDGPSEDAPSPAAAEAAEASEESSPEVVTEQTQDQAQPAGERPAQAPEAGGGDSPQAPDPATI